VCHSGSNSLVNQRPCKKWGCHDGDDKHSRFLKPDSVYSGKRLPTFRGSLLSPPSGQSKQSSWNTLNVTTTNSSETPVTLPCTWPHIPDTLNLLLATLFYSQNNPYFVRSTTEAIIIVERGYNDIGLCDISPIQLYILWYILISHKARAFLPCLVRHT
jgi:hypothetical protein